ncbi:aminoglycoside phosphotransferase family protein [Actinoplanes sp. N902-109]|uniref:phosphotransferase n=1 Tax=Actinoplanes sp. (strain N902-109) TaxID=649831 RepID=UPI0003295EE8|nr:aminoglycoside phosphotransferase family protein [Actinoplanes sp. N902-109]AGL17924.1 aminoglycoside phosphotransferase [Actinoplanes sp. N902-109]
MFTPPADLPEPVLLAAIERGWSRTGTVVHRPVGFGSHHWELAGTDGSRWFVTVDDLRSRDRHALTAALGAAQALRATGRDFVVAPVPARDGSPVTVIGDTFAVALYPFVDGESFGWGEFRPEQRRAVLDLLVSVHGAPASVAGQALREDFTIALRDAVTASIDPAAGPYAQPTAGLLAAHAAGLRAAFRWYDDLVAAVRTEPGTMVLTHGEPHPGNTMRADGRWLLIDWDTALLAPPERDLWDLDPGDGTVHAAYTAATGTALRPGVLDLYRLRWDLAEVAVCTARFRQPHERTADDAETWEILERTVPALRARP